MPGNEKADKISLLNRIHREEWLRGSRFINEEEYNNRVLEDLHKNDIQKGFMNVGGCILSTLAEPEHVYIEGKPGVGKSVLTYQVVEQIIRNGQKAVVYDFKGDYLSKFYEPKRDMIFNPLDKRGVKWNIISEIKSQGGSSIKRMAAINSICYSLIPNQLNSERDKFFYDGARAVLKSLIEYNLTECPKSDQNNQGLIYILSGSDQDILEKVQKVNPIAANYISIPGSNQTAGVLAVLSQFSESLLCMKYPDGNFTVNEWVNNGQEGILFVTGFADIRDMLRPILSLLIDTIAKHVLSLPDSLTNRIFFILDEFATLQRLNSLIELLTLSRSKGGSVWLVTQDLSQVENLYGRLKNSIVNACGTKIIFAVADPHDAREFSDFIGEAEYLAETVQDSGILQGEGGISDTDGRNRNFHRQTIIKKVMLPANIMNQKKFNFIFRSYPYSFVRSAVTLRSYENREPNLVLADS